jgi:hypothetical protein
MQFPALGVITMLLQVGQFELWTAQQIQEEIWGVDGEDEGSATGSACLRTHRYRQHLPTNTSEYTYIDQLVYTVTVTDENRSHKITGTCICMYTCMYYK